MKERTTFVPLGMQVIKGFVALEIRSEDYLRLAKAFKCAGAYYIRERFATNVAGNTYAAAPRRPRNPA